MANSDNTHGVFNKLSKDYKLVRIDRASGNLIEPNEILAQSFGGNIETAKDYFLTSDAKACFEAYGTQVQFGITADGNGLAWTIAFGTKGAGTAEGADHAAKWTETKDALIAADNWIAGDREGVGAIAWAGGGGSGAGDNGEPYTWLATDSAEHLF